MLDHGPYKNLHFEDRELWTRLESQGQLVRFSHGQLRIRMKIPQPAKTIKIVKRNYARILEDIQQPEASVITYLLEQLRRTSVHGMKDSLFRSLMLMTVLPEYFYRGKVRFSDSNKEHIPKNKKQIDVSFNDLCVENGIKKEDFFDTPDALNIF